MFFDGGIMGTLNGHFRQSTDQRSEDEITHETGASCIAWVWLALYGIAIVGSLLLGPERQKHETPVATAVSLER
jgi:hypothetical protein